MNGHHAKVCLHLDDRIVALGLRGRQPVACATTATTLKHPELHHLRRTSRLVTNVACGPTTFVRSTTKQHVAAGKHKSPIFFGLECDAGE